MVPPCIDLSQRKPCGRTGFLGYDASFMLDVVMVALVLVVPVLAFSILQARAGRYLVHQRIQLSLAVVLLLAVMAFEVDLQLVHGGWENVVNKDPDSPRLTGENLDFVRRVLWVHLVFAVSTPLLWGVTIAPGAQANPRASRPVRAQPAPPSPWLGLRGGSDPYGSDGDGLLLSGLHRRRVSPLWADDSTG